jgi:hypothetical protein
MTLLLAETKKKKKKKTRTTRDVGKVIQFKGLRRMFVTDTWLIMIKDVQSLTNLLLQSSAHCEMGFLPVALNVPLAS